MQVAGITVATLAFPKTVRLVSTARLREAVLASLVDTTDEFAELAEIEESGFLELLASEADGGVGLGFDVAIPLFMALGRKLAPLEIGNAMIARAGRVPVDDENANAVLCAAAIAGAGNHLLASQPACVHHP